jgi:hypothetical protein
MSSLDQARNTQLKNIEAKTGKSLAELGEVIERSGLTKHSEIRDMLRNKYELGYGDANALAHFAKASDGQSAALASEASLDDLLAELYSGKKSDLRPLHAAVMGRIQEFGEFETVPKKGYFSLRRKKQFAMIGPGTKGRLEIGLNMKDIEGTDRLEAQKPGGMCQFKVFLTSLPEVDDEFVGWAKYAYDNAG